MSLKVSIIIISFNRADDLKCCLESIQKQTYLNYEIIVMDNGSQDLTESFIQKATIPNLFYYRALENWGTSYARNAGVCFASGHYIWFLDSDSEILEEDCLSKYVEYFEREQQVGVIGGEAVISTDNDVVGVKLQRLRPNGFSRGEHLSKGSLKETDVITTCNFLTTREIFMEVGGFDLSYFLPYFDDVDISYRIFKTNRKLMVLGEGFVLHKYSRNVRYRGEGLDEAMMRLYFVLKEFPLKNIFLLPLLDLQMIFRLENFGRIKRLLLLSNYGKQSTVVQLTKKNSKISINGLFQIVLRLFRFLVSMLVSYFVILPKIPGILKKRNKFISYLNGIDLNKYKLTPVRHKY